MEAINSRLIVVFSGINCVSFSWINSYSNRFITRRGRRLRRPFTISTLSPMLEVSEASRLLSCHSPASRQYNTISITNSKPSHITFTILFYIDSTRWEISTVATYQRVVVGLITDIVKMILKFLRGKLLALTTFKWTKKCLSQVSKYSTIEDWSIIIQKASSKAFNFKVC